MNNELGILLRMREANVPPHAYLTSLKVLNQNRLSQIVANKEYDLKESGVRNYVIRKTATVKYGLKGASKITVSKVCAVMAKELVLQRRKVYYTTLHEMVLCLRVLDPGTPIHAFFGKGYLVLGDLGMNVQHLTEFEWGVVQSYLMQHIAKGGGLIIGDTGLAESGRISSDMCDAFDDFTIVEVA